MKFLIKGILKKKAESILKENGLTDGNGKPPTVAGLCAPEHFAEAAMHFCENEDVFPEELGPEEAYILTAYYGAICSAVLYYRSGTPATPEEVLDYMYDGTENEAEDADPYARWIGGAEASDGNAKKIRRMILPYVSLVKKLFSKAGEPSDDLTLFAMERAYEIGNAAAAYYSGNDGLPDRDALEKALEALARTAKGKKRRPPPQSAMCYCPAPTRFKKR